MQLDSVEDLCILCIGICLHLMEVSLFGVNFPNFMIIVPNIPSTLLVIAILVAMIEWRPIRGTCCFAMSQWEYLLRLAMELIIIVCVAEILLVCIWIPILTVICELCQWVIEGYIEDELPNLANWLDNYLFYLLRFLLAMCLISGIAVYQGWVKKAKGFCARGNTAQPKVEMEVGPNRRARPLYNNDNMPEHMPINERRPNIEGPTNDSFRKAHDIRSVTTSHSVA